MELKVGDKVKCKLSEETLNILKEFGMIISPNVYKNENQQAKIVEIFEAEVTTAVTIEILSSNERMFVYKRDVIKCEGQE